MTRSVVIANQGAWGVAISQEVCNDLDVDGRASLPTSRTEGSLGGSPSLHKKVARGVPTTGFSIS
jgi:hypothetical protein